MNIKGGGYVYEYSHHPFGRLMCFCFVISQCLSSFALRRFGGAFGCQSFSSFTHFATVMYSHRIYLPLLALWRARIVAMAVCGLDTSVHAVDNEFSALISTNLSSCVYSLPLGCKMTAGSLSAVTLYIPTSVGIMNNMVRRTCHINYCIFRKNCASVPEERSAIPLQTEQSSAG